MKFVAVLATLSLGVGAVWAVQQTVHYVSADGATEMTYTGMQVLRTSNDAYRLILTGGVHVANKKENTTVAARKATLTFGSQAGKTALKTIHAEENVVITQTKAARKSTIQSSTADYREDAAQPTADFNGNVVLVDTDATHHRIVNATGSQGHAVFSGKVGGKGSTLKSAVLTGQVVIHMDQAPLGTQKPGKLLVRCSRLTYLPGSSGSTVDVEGDVSMDGTNGAVSGTMRNLQKVRFQLDSKNEVTSFQSGGSE